MDNKYKTISLREEVFWEIKKDMAKLKIARFSDYINYLREKIEELENNEPPEFNDHQA